MIEDCTAIILAGGDSQRMGFDKANLQLGDQSLLQRVMEAMQQLFPSIIVSVRQPRPEINLTQVCDELENAGPLAGFTSCLAHAKTPWVFVVACDMPFVSPALVEYLATQRSNTQAVVPVAHGHPQPLAAYYSITCLDVIREYLSGGGKKSVRGVLEKLKVRYVDEIELLKVDPSLQSFFDLDTPRDVVEAKSLEIQ